MNKIERKYVDLKELKVRDDGPGTIEGYRSVFEIDEGGDLVIKGAFADCIPEFLSSGFTAHSHSWNFSEAIGFPVAAFEDEYGWFVRSQFHSTPDAQAIRTKAKERLKAGKRVGFSFGYSVDDFEFVQARDYERVLSRYIKPDRFTANLAKAQRFSQVRILKKVSAVEDSLVTAPMNKLAGATAVKAHANNIDVSRLRCQSVLVRARAVLALAPSLDPADELIARARMAVRESRFRLSSVRGSR